MINMMELPLTHDPHAPQIFAVHVGAIVNLGNGNIIATLESIANSEDGELCRVVVGRLILPVRGAQEFVAKLNGFLEANGLSPSKALTGGATKQ